MTSHDQNDSYYDRQHQSHKECEKVPPEFFR